MQCCGNAISGREIEPIRVVPSQGRDSLGFEGTTVMAHNVYGVIVYNVVAVAAGHGVPVALENDN